MLISLKRNIDRRWRRIRFLTKCWILCKSKEKENQKRMSNSMILLLWGMLRTDLWRIWCTKTILRKECRTIFEKIMILLCEIKVRQRNSQLIMKENLTLNIFRMYMLDSRELYLILSLKRKQTKVWIRLSVLSTKMRITIRSIFKDITFRLKILFFLLNQNSGHEQSH